LARVDWDKEPIAVNLQKSKGFLIEQTLKRLHSLEEKYSSVSSINEREALLFEAAKVTVVASHLRNVQIGNNTSWEDVILHIESAYKPHHDTSNSEIQFRDLKLKLGDIEKVFKSKGAFTKEESSTHCEMLEKYGSLCLQIYGCLERDKQQEQATELEENNLNMAM
jgi:hypothetical protein